ncbi:MAG TPA: prephenate/arogenate dehydrogenase family protein, partial [Alphaproteobacteria bacterium]|nr:prephenate/arogenate dehydrogenase family protein [Alphaproteobacteria bacterium]
MGQPLYERVALIGTGLIGGSIARATKRGGLSGHVSGYAPSAEERARVRTIGFCDSVSDTLADAVQDADLVILCAPVGVLGEVAAQIGPHLKPGATVSDVGSVKMAVVRDVGPHVPAGGH